MTANEEKAKVLICECEKEMATILESRLHDLGYTVCDIANSAREILALVEVWKPDLVMMNIALGGEIDGIEAAEIIRNKWSLPVVFLTAEAHADWLSRAKLTYPFGYLLKPFGTRDLKITVEMALYVAEVARERRREENLRRESEARLNLFMNHFPGVAFIKDRDGRVVFANDQYYEVGGLERSEVEGKPYPEYLSPDMVAIFRREDEMVLSQNDCLEMEHVYPTGKGDTYWLTKKFPIPRKDDSPLIGGISIDVTERVQANEALQDSEKKFRSISEQMIETVFLTDRQGIITYMSPVAREIFGMPVEEMVGRHFMEFLTEESMESAIPAFLETLEKGIPTKTMHLHMKRKDGSTFVGELSGRVYLKQGMIVGTIGVIRDITEQKTAEDALTESRANLSALTENTDGSIWSVDRNYRLIVGNSEFQRNAMALNGKPFIPGKNVLDCLREMPDVWEEWQGYYDRALGGERFSVETCWRQIEPKVYMEHRLSPIQAPDGSTTGATVYGRDITAYKHAEQQIQAALQEKEILLKELNHRVKNNMQVIISLMKLQSDRLEDESTKAVFLESQSRIYAMAAVHESLHQSDNLNSIDLSSYIMKLCVTTFQIYRTDAGNIKLSVEVNPIRVKLEQSYPIGLAINELLSNALKYAFPGGRQGKIKISGEKGEGQRVRITISDNGVGIPDGFDFRKADSLGLQLVTSLIEGQLGGTVALNRTPGTHWEITFPVSD